LPVEERLLERVQGQYAAGTDPERLVANPTVLSQLIDGIVAL
jgi:hypothetical protein